RRAQRPRARRRLDADRRAGGGAPRAHDAGGRRAARLRRRGRRPGRRPLAGATRMIELSEGVALSRFTTLGTGGPARWFARPSTAEELVETLAWAAARDVVVEVVGLGSNLLVHDDGVEALVLRLAGDLAAVAVEGTELVAGGGATNA